MLELNVIEKRISDAGQIALYGAGVTAYNIAVALKEVYNIVVEKYYVTSVSESHRFFGGIKPVSFSEYRTDEGELVLVATPNEYHSEIEKRLILSGVTDYILINQDIEYFIMKRYFAKTADYKFVEDLNTVDCKQTQNDRMLKAETYMAKNINDRKLVNSYHLPEWIIPVQAGAALTDQRILPLTDNDGINISDKNRDYSELTVTYWAWKNRNADYMGICHYRRMILLTDTDIDNVIKNNIDAVLPLPFVCSPDASEQYGRYIKQEDFQVFMQIIEETMPQRLDNIRMILNGKILYNYNMLLAKKAVFNDYCDFMFTILQKMDEYYRDKNINRNDRYLGYFGELLTSIFFVLNSSELKIVHAGRLWMV